MSYGSTLPWRCLLAEELKPLAVVYDCMDEFSAFLGAASATDRARGVKLLEKADLVFTGGPSLYRAKQNRHPQCPLFSEQRRRERHFAQARMASREPKIKRLCRIRAWASVESSTNGWMRRF